MRINRRFIVTTAVLTILPGAAMVAVLTTTTPANAAVSCTGTSLIPDGLVAVRVPTVGNGTGNDNCDLGLGNNGVAVERLQIALDECDSAAFSPALTVDGDYGPLTENAVELTQAYWGVPVDGVYGPQTRDAMSWPVAGTDGDACVFLG
jgi:peptidoglycan hydrolase-like protein with peptidoglycan-binding domain